MAKKYSTAFALTEDPLSESSVWAAPSNTNLTRMRSASGHAIAKAQGAGAYDDSAAHLSGYAANYEITTSVYKDGTLVNTATHECEHLMRINDGASATAQYEALYSFTGSTQCVRWFNNAGSQDFEFLSALTGAISIGGEFSTGDRIRTRVAGAFIIMSAIIGATETLLGVYVNTVLTSGQPGVGGYTRVSDGGDASKFAFDDAQISDIFVDQVLASDNFTRANENPLSGGGNWSTPSGLSSLRIISNEVANASAGTDSGERFTGVAAGLDHYSQINIGSSIGDSDFGPAVCVQANGDMYLVTGFNGVELFIFSRIGGAFDQMGVVTASYGTADDIRLERFGSLLRLYQNSVLILTVDTATASTILVEGAYGIFGYDGNYRIASWQGGKLVADYDGVPGSGGTVTTQTLSDSFLLSDASIRSAIKGRVQGDATVMTDASLFSFLRAAILTDALVTADEARVALVRNRLLEDTLIVTDGFISQLTASQIFTKIATSLVDVNDEGFVTLLRNLSVSDLLSIADSSIGSIERNLLGSDSFVINDSSLLQRYLTRGLESPVDFQDSQFNFKLLTRRLESLPQIQDSFLSVFVDGEASLVDWSNIKIGVERRSIPVGVELRLISLGSVDRVRIH